MCVATLEEHDRTKRPINMGLQDFSNNNETNGEDKKASDGYCPRCETKGEETEYWYYRCTTPSKECPVITFIVPNR